MDIHSLALISLLVLNQPQQQAVKVIYYISTVNTQRMQRPDVLIQLGYVWRHVLAVNRPSSGQQRLLLLRYSQI